MMRKIISWETGAIALAITLAGACKPREKAAPPPPLSVTVAPVGQKDVFEMRTWVGLLNGFQNSDIRAQVTGYLLSQNYKEGSFVKKGAVLFTIDSRPFVAALAQSQADYAKAVAQEQLAQITLGRQTQLYKNQVISQQEFDTSTQNTKAAIAAVGAAAANVETAQINLNYCTITAPFDGIAGAAQAQIGDLVGPAGTASVLTQMSQVNPIKANFSITEEEYLKAAALLTRLQAKKEENTEGHLELRLAGGTVYPHKGRFDFVNRQIDTSTGTIQITALFPNEDNILRPGLFGRITAPVDELKGALVVPQVATVEIQGKYMVSIVGPDDIVHPTPVELGPTEGQMQVVTGNLKAGDSVVVGGVEKIRPGMKVNPKPFETPPPPNEKSPVPAPSPGPSEPKTGFIREPAAPDAFLSSNRGRQSLYN